MFLCGFFYFALGSSLGSFMHEIYSRYRPELSLSKFLCIVCFRASQCDYCQKKLKYWQLIPVLSWLFQKKKTSCCYQSLPSLYFWIEFCCGLFMFIIFMHFGLTIQSIFLMFIVMISIPIMLIDCRYFLIPDFFHFVLIGFAIIYIYCNASQVNGISGDFIIMLFTQISSGIFALLLLALPRCYYLYRYKIEAMGIGDLKLAFSLGLFLPFEQIPIFILLAAFLGLCNFAILWCFKKYRIKLIPFAPALLIAQWIIFLHTI